MLAIKIKKYFKILFLNFKNKYKNNVNIKSNVIVGLKRNIENIEIIIKVTLRLLVLLKRK